MPDPRVVRRLLRAPPELHYDSRPAMGTSFEAWLFLDARAEAAAIFEVVFEEIERLDATLSHFKPTSEISRLNRRAGRGAVVTDPEVFALLDRCLGLAAETGGAFDITIGRLVDAWGFGGGEMRVPSPAELRRAMRAGGHGGVELGRAERSVRFTRPGLQLDLGAVGKGYALDRAAAQLRGLGVEHALLGAGQSSFVAVGPPPGRDGWPVTVSLTRGGAPISTPRLECGSLSTSGVGGRYFEAGGKLYGHILDPRSGTPVEGTIEASVLALTGEVSDALSTALMVLGGAGADILTVHDARGLLVTGSERAPRAQVFGWPAAVEGPLRPE